MNIEAERHNRIRVMVLKFLAPQHPNMTDAVLIRRLLADFGYPISEQSLKSYLAYLQERGCVTIMEKPKWGIVMVSITAKGLDILDGRVVEQGIELD